MNKEKLESLLFFRDYLVEPTKGHLISFMNGFLRGNLENMELLHLMATYLRQRHGVEVFLNTWEEQVDCYAVLKGLSWYDAFYALLDEMYDFEGVLEPIVKVDTEFDDLIFDWGEVVEGALGGFGEEDIAVGMLIRLGDKLGEDYRRTKLYDQQLTDHTWDMFYPSAQDFQYVHLFHLDQQASPPLPANLGRARRIFSHFTAEITAIRQRNGVYYLYTQLFEIELAKALAAGEIAVIKPKEHHHRYDYMAKGIKESIDSYRTFPTHYDTFPSLQEFIALRLFTYFNDSILEWQNYRRGHNGKWMKV